jgi:uncharacterized NAD-dependent epimerase/dehydratase family protein
MGEKGNMGKMPALVYVDRYFKCADGKIAHGLVRYSKRYDVLGVVDSTLQKGDAGVLLDGAHRGIPVFTSLDEALSVVTPQVFIIGAVSDGGVLPDGYGPAVTWALHHGLDVVSGLHEFLSDNPIYRELAEKNCCTITDVRKMFRDYKRFYTGEISQVDSTRIALIGTDSAIGKRTVAVSLVKDLWQRKRRADMIFTGQTGWMQGWKHGVVLDAMINDFVAGGIEGAILDSWRDNQPDFMVIEGQGSLLHPFYPGGFEILAAGQIHGFILVDAPGRPHLDGFPQYPMPDSQRVVHIAELLTGKNLLGIAMNHENLTGTGRQKAQDSLRDKFHVPVVDPLIDGVGALSDILLDMR